MRKAFAKIILAVLLAFFGIAGVQASYVVTPVKQYGISYGSTYSDWYLVYQNELGKEHNGQLYSSPEYQEHFALWLKVEGLSEDKVSHNPKLILTIPVSGKLAEDASYYAIWSDTENSVPSSVVIGEKTYERSAENGAENLYTVVSVAPAVAVPPEITVAPVSVSHQPISIPAAATVPDATPGLTISKELTLSIGLLFVFLLLVLAFWIKYLQASNREMKDLLLSKEEEMKSHEKEIAALRTQYQEILGRTLREFTLSDAALLEAIDRANILVRIRDKVYLPLTNGREEIFLSTGHIVKNKDKNILAGIKELHRPFLVSEGSC
ncbi:MAG: hypothetical protein WCT49_01990 [Candidatus Paceibacterota bacterium]|jgi:hypothetical protein|nr:hypothetical protein [Candidatus Paceibacterota bacterium]